VCEDETVEEAFHKRNQAIFLLLVAMKERGHTVGYRIDDNQVKSGPYSRLRRSVSYRGMLRVRNSRIGWSGGMCRETGILPRRSMSGCRILPTTSPAKQTDR
jgi:hypothetical protein